MADTTTIRVSRSTRDALMEAARLADAPSADALIRRLLWEWKRQWFFASVRAAYADGPQGDAAAAELGLEDWEPASRELLDDRG